MYMGITKGFFLIVFQNYNLIPHQTVLANVELALTLSGVGKAERRRRAEEALRKVGLGDQLKKKPSQMSGGQMQRVAIARAMCTGAAVFTADEPTGRAGCTGGKTEGNGKDRASVRKNRYYFPVPVSVQGDGGEITAWL